MGVSRMTVSPTARSAARTPSPCQPTRQTSSRSNGLGSSPSSTTRAGNTWATHPRLLASAARPPRMYLAGHHPGLPRRHPPDSLHPPPARPSCRACRASFPARHRFRVQHGECEVRVLGRTIHRSIDPSIRSNDPSEAWRTPHGEWRLVGHSGGGPCAAGGPLNGSACAGLWATADPTMRDGWYSVGTSPLLNGECSRRRDCHSTDAPHVYSY